MQSFNIKICVFSISLCLLFLHLLLVHYYDQQNKVGVAKVKGSFFSMPLAKEKYT